MEARNVISNIIRTHGTIRQVYWAACGGSLVDLYPGHCLISRESTITESGLYTAEEFLLAPPRKLSSSSLVILCSHSGGTRETLEAAELALDKGAAVIMLTNRADSPAAKGRYFKETKEGVNEQAAQKESWITWVYPWDEALHAAEIPGGIVLSLAAELVKAQEPFEAYDALMDGVSKMDSITDRALQKVHEELCEPFAKACKDHDFLYILGSGCTFAQTYGFAICSLMEMQWQHCAYIHSGEYFHGPFEVTENGVFYFLQKSSGCCRKMDQRAEDFLRTHTDSLMVLDALEYGMDEVDLKVRDYLDPILFYRMNCELRSARGRLFDHDVDYRRYMGKVPY